MTCALCESRKAKRFCPALTRQICPQCCGEAREQTLHCPLECPFLAESREHERRPGLNPEDFPFPDIRISESFLRSNEDLLTAAGQAVLSAAVQVPGAADGDVREALDSLARTYKTLESGVYYETRPQNPLAQAIAQGIQQMLQQFRQQDAQRTGVTRVRDADVLGILVFLLRMAMDEDNGRRLCKRFLHKLYEHFTPEQPSSAGSGVIVPG